MKDSFPEKQDEELRNIEKGFYHFLCDYIVETIKLTSMSKEEMNKHVHYKGVEHIYDYLKEGHNVAIYLGHYCNWEWITSIMLHLPQTIYGGQVYHILQNKVLNALLLAIRERMGTISVSMQLILRKIIETRRQGKQMVIGFISDQVPLSQSTHHFTSFLNHPQTPVITGTEVIAKKCDFSCVYFDIKRPCRGRYDIDVIPMCSNSKEYADWDLTEKYFKLLEDSIQRNPQYWLWTHNRWKRGAKEFCDWVELSGTATESQVALAKRLKDKK